MNAPASTFADVSSPELYRDDAWREHFAMMRREDPVHRHPDSPHGPYWSVTRYADIMKVELDHATYSSASEMGGIESGSVAPPTNPVTLGVDLTMCQVSSLSFMFTRM